MLEASGLKDDQQRMILTSTANNREFEKLAAALVEQYPSVHLDEGTRTSHPSQGAKGGKSYRKPYRHARLAEDEENGNDDEESSEEEGNLAPQAHLAGGMPQLLEDDEEEVTKEDVELDVYTCMVCLSEDADEGDIAKMCQMETTAFIAWNKFKKGGNCLLYTSDAADE